MKRNVERLSLVQINCSKLASRMKPGVEEMKIGAKISISIVLDSTLAFKCHIS